MSEKAYINFGLSPVKDLFLNWIAVKPERLPPRPYFPPTCREYVEALERRLNG